MNWRSWLPERPPRPWQSVLVGIGLGAVAMATRMAVMRPFGRELPFLTFFPALVVAAAWGGVNGGVACLAMASLSVVLLIPDSASSPWAMAAFWVAGGLIILVAAALSASVRELRQSHSDLDRARSQLQTLVGELAHRNRNALFVIMAIVRQSAQGAPSAKAAEEIINGRLEAMMRAQEVVVDSAQGATLRPLLEKSLAPFGLDRFEISGTSDVAIDPAVATGLGLLFHELATNAMKHGALSTSRGRVQITWIVDEALARLTWTEEGGPIVTASSTRKGFGSRLIEVALVPQGGGVERRFELGGVVCEARIPLATDGSAVQLSTHGEGEVFANRLSLST